MGADHGDHDGHEDPHPRCKSLFDHETVVLRRLRAACSEASGRPLDYPFFLWFSRAGEDADDTLLRLFKDRQWWTAASDEKVIAMMTGPLRRRR